MRNYDFAFSLGFSCGTSQALRAAGMQFASFPLDWVGSPSVVASARMIADDFRNWLEPEDLKLWDVRHGTGFCTRIYKNMRTGFGFSHEFSDFVRFEASYPSVKAMYERRIDRFLTQLKASRRILAVYTEMPILPRPKDEDLLEARSILQAKAPQAEIDLVCFFVEPGCRKPVAKTVADGVTAVGVDYRKFDCGEVSHFLEVGLLTRFLKENYTVDDPRDDEGRRRFAAEAKQSDAWRWGKGKSWLRRWINKRAYKLYRQLERILLKRGMVHREGPLWFIDVNELEAGR